MSQPRTSQRSKLTAMILLALYLAIMLMLKVTGIGMIYIGPISLTLFCVIVVVGTITLGLGSGLFLGLAFGLLSFWDGMTIDPTGLLIKNESVPLLLGMCVLPRLLIPVVTWLVCKGMLGIRIRQRNVSLSLSSGVAAVCGSLTNTVFFLAALWLSLTLLGWTTAEKLAELGIGAKSLIALILGVAASNGVFEAIIAGVVTPPIVIGVDAFSRKH